MNGAKFGEAILYISQRCAGKVHTHQLERLQRVLTAESTALGATGWVNSGSGPKP